MFVVHSVVHRTVGDPPRDRAITHLNLARIGLTLHTMAKRNAAAKRASARKAASKKVATKTAVRSSTTGRYVIFDSPLKPKHVTEEQIKQAVKAAA